MGSTDPDDATESAHRDRTSASELLTPVKQRLNGFRSEARAGAIVAVVMVASSTLVSPAAAAMGTKIGNAICKTGAGKLITGALFIVAILLIYGSLGDFYKGFKNSRSKSTGQRSQQSNDFENGGKKLGGGLLMAAAPTILSTIGFSLLSCVKAVQIF